MKTYQTSLAELVRREHAFYTLSGSLITGVLVSGFLNNIAPEFILIFSLLLVSVLLASIFFLQKFFRSYAGTRFQLDNINLLRTGVTTEKLNLQELTRINIVRTSTNKLRSLKLSCKDGRSITVNAVGDFETFCQDLLSSIPAGIPVIYNREPLDYDHPLFYLGLGLAVGSLAMLLVKFITSSVSNTRELFFIFSGVFATLLGGYLLVTQQTKAYYGTRNKAADIILGLLLTLAGICMLLLAGSI